VPGTHCILVIVACKEFPDLEDCSFILGQEDEAAEGMETEQEEEESCTKMPAVAKAPPRPKKPLQQSTLMQTVHDYYGPTLVLPVAAMPVAAMPVARECQLLDRSFMPPYFITLFPTGPVTCLVGVVVNLPGGVAS